MTDITTFKNLLVQTADNVVRAAISNLAEKDVFLWHIALYFSKKFEKKPLLTKYSQSVNRLIIGKEKNLTKDQTDALHKFTDKFVDCHWDILGSLFQKDCYVELSPYNVVTWFTKMGGYVSVDDDTVTFEYKGRDAYVEPLVLGKPKTSPGLGKWLQLCFPGMEFKTFQAVPLAMKLTNLALLIGNPTRDKLSKVWSIDLHPCSTVVNALGELPHAMKYADGKFNWIPSTGIAWKQLFNIEDIRCKELLSKLTKKYSSITFYKYFLTILQDVLNVSKDLLVKRPTLQNMDFYRGIISLFAPARVDVQEAQRTALYEKHGPKIAFQVLSSSRTLRGQKDLRGDDITKNIHIGLSYPNGYSTANKIGAIAKYAARFEADLKPIEVKESGDVKNDYTFDDAPKEELKVKKKVRGYDKVLIYGAPPGHMHAVVDEVLDRKEGVVQYYDIKVDEGRHRIKWKRGDVFERLFVEFTDGRVLVISDAWSSPEKNKIGTNFLAQLAVTMRKWNGSIQHPTTGKYLKTGKPFISYSGRGGTHYKNLEEIHYFVKMVLPIPHDLRRLDKNWIPDVFKEMILYDPLYVYSSARPHNLEFYASNIPPQDYADTYFDFHCSITTVEDLAKFVEKLCLRSIRGNIWRNSYHLSVADLGQKPKFILDKGERPDLTAVVVGDIVTKHDLIPIVDPTDVAKVIGDDDDLDGLEEGGEFVGDGGGTIVQPQDEAVQPVVHDDSGGPKSGGSAIATKDDLDGMSFNTD